MKTIRQTRPGALWLWLKANLPRSLVAEEVQVGYGKVCAIYQQSRQRGVMSRLFYRADDATALVYERVIELHHPQYFSDFENLILRYEQHTGEEVTLRYWESQKDEIRPDGQGVSHG